jgi:hypothetical protein
MNDRLPPRDFHARTLLHDFREDEKTTPPAVERGLPREAAVLALLRRQLPGRYGVGSGVIFDRHGGQSEQCDVVIYDAKRTPRLSTDRPLAMKIWPYDFVYGIVQVKSKLTRSALRDAVGNVAAFKRLKPGRWRRRLPLHGGSEPARGSFARARMGR